MTKHYTRAKMSVREVENPTSEWIVELRSKREKSVCLLWLLIYLEIWLAGLVTGISIANG
jgi:hypothetical protein